MPTKPISDRELAEIVKADDYSSMSDLQRRRITAELVAARARIRSLEDFYAELKESTERHLMAVIKSLNIHVIQAERRGE